jgi:hypothetical protein
LSQSQLQTENNSLAHVFQGTTGSDRQHNSHGAHA